MADPTIAQAAPPERRLRDLRREDVSAIVVARIVSAERRQVTRRSDGNVRPVVSGFLSDGTASVRFTWWDPPQEEVERGQVIRAGPVTVGEFRGRLEVTFGWKTKVEPASETELPELTSEERLPRGLGSLAVGEDGFVIEVRIAEVAPRLVTVGMERRTVFSGILLDATGSVGLSSWADFRLARGQTVRIERAHVREFQGRPQVVLDSWSRVERIEAAHLPAPESLGAETMPLGRLGETNGAERVRIEGVAVALQPPSGPFTRCPHCRRGTEGGICRAHGPVEGVPDLRLRLVLDDGTGTATVQFDRELAERWTGLTLPALQARLSATPDPGLLEAEIHRSLFGRRFRVVGAARTDAFGTTISPAEVGEIGTAGATS